MKDISDIDINLLNCFFIEHEELLFYRKINQKFKHEFLINIGIINSDSVDFCIIKKYFISKLTNHKEYNKEEQDIFLNLIEVVSDHLSSRGCNDFTFPDFYKKETINLFKDYYYSDIVSEEEKNDFEEDLKDNRNFEMSFDFIVLAALKYRFRNYFKYICQKNKITNF